MHNHLWQPAILVSAENVAAVTRNLEFRVLLVWMIGLLLAKIKRAHTEICRYDLDMAVLNNSTSVGESYF